MTKFTEKNIYNPDVHFQFAESFSEKALRPFAYMLSRRLHEGHICVTEKEVLEDESVKKYFNTPSAPEWNKLKTWVGSPDDEPRPFIRTVDDKIYLHRYYSYETTIVSRIREMVDRSKAKTADRMARLELQKGSIQLLGNAQPPEGASTPDEKTDWQLVGALKCLLNDFFILTGGPGTGKTTTLARILKILFLTEPGIRVRLAAPTGKAAARMKESLGDSVKNDPEAIRNKINDLEASTLHRLLGYRYNHVQFKHNRENPMNYDLIVVDESSMIDIPMMAKLLDAMPENGRLVLLGDRDQLASVEAGSLLGDLFQSVSQTNLFPKEEVDWLNGFIANDDCRIKLRTDIPEPTGLLANSMVELRFSRRFQQQGDIGKLARAIIRFDRDQLEAMLKAPASKSLRFELEDDKFIEDFALGYSEFIREKDETAALRLLGNLRVLATVREGKRGLQEINKRIEKYLHNKKLIKTDSEFYENRPVLITRNIHDLGIMNGDVGIVRRQNGIPKIWIYQDEVKAARPFLPAYIPYVETNFAMTVHKSQGSEFSSVMVVLPDDPEHPLLTRELLYTGITRAKDSVVVVGSEQVIKRASDRGVSRTSDITRKLI